MKWDCGLERTNGVAAAPDRYSPATSHKTAQAATATEISPTGPISGNQSLTTHPKKNIQSSDSRCFCTSLRSLGHFKGLVGAVGSVAIIRASASRPLVA